MPTATAHDVEQQILERLRPALDAWYSGDPMPYANLLADDGTYFAPPTGGRLDGADAVRASYKTIVGKIHVPRWTIASPALDLDGETGVFTYQLEEYARGDDTPTMTWNATEVYRRRGDDWQVIHAHWSPR